MGLIIKNKIPMLKKGYPTVSDKYNVSGAVLSGSNSVEFGDLVLKDTQTSEGCYFTAVGSTTVTTSNVGGFVVATNVKLAEEWPGQTVKVNPGEAFNLLVSGFLAIKLDASLISSGDLTTKPSANGQVYVTASGGKITPVSTSNVALTGAVFTGLYEVINSTTAYAEIYVK